MVQPRGGSPHPETTYLRPPQYMARLGLHLKKQTFRRDARDRFARHSREMECLLTCNDRAPAGIGTAWFV